MSAASWVCGPPTLGPAWTPKGAGCTRIVMPVVGRCLHVLKTPAGLSLAKSSLPPGYANRHLRSPHLCRLAESAVELTLRLRRWRAAPALDVGAIAGGPAGILGQPMLPHTAAVTVCRLSVAACWPRARLPSQQCSMRALSCAPRLCCSCPPLPPPRSGTLPAVGCRHAGLLRGSHAAGVGRAPHHFGGQLACGVQQPGRVEGGRCSNRLVGDRRGCSTQGGTQLEPEPLATPVAGSSPACCASACCPAPYCTIRRCASLSSTLRTAWRAASPRLQLLPRRWSESFREQRPAACSCPSLCRGTPLRRARWSRWAGHGATVL